MSLRWLGLICALAVVGCAYQHYAGPFVAAVEQPPHSEVRRGGGVAYNVEGLEVVVRPLTVGALNQQFAGHSVDGPKSTNPYTFGDTRFWEGEEERERFTVFKLVVRNQTYPKIKIDPSRIVLRSANGREYWSLSLAQLGTYYRAYATGYQGNEYARYQERMDLLRRTLYSNDEVFSNQEIEGYVVFPTLHRDVHEVEFQIHDVVLRFDNRNEPAETAEISYQFRRDIGRIYPDGRLQMDDA